MLAPLAARGRDATAEADLAEALRRSRLTAQREKRKRAAADRRSFNVACTLSGLRAELDRREQRRQEAQYAEQLHEAIVQSRQAEEERRARAALNEARDVARAIDASLLSHTRWGQLPDDVIELVLDIMQEERVQHELVVEPVLHGMRHATRHGVCGWQPRCQLGVCTLGVYERGRLTSCTCGVECVAVVRYVHTSL